MRRYVFADEAGCFAFNRHQRASRYFIICTVSLDSCAVGDRLMSLRRDLAWKKAPLRDYFHACEDRQEIRDAVFAEIAKEKFTVQATILEKSKAQPQTRVSEQRFYQYAWYYHFRYAHKKILCGANELHVTAASIGGKKKQRQVFNEAVTDVLKQSYGQRVFWQSGECPASGDPCLQVVDYCTWAIQRKWERGDARSYDLIKDKIDHEYDTWQRGNKHYY